MKKLFINVPVCDLREEPSPHQVGKLIDRQQSSQLLFGESAHILEEKGDWYYVECCDQEVLEPSGEWEGYKGWIPKTVGIEGKSVGGPLIVIKPQAMLYLFEKPSIRILYSSILFGEESSGWHWKVFLPDGSQGFISKQDVQSLDALETLSKGQKQKIICHDARYFLGAPYFWGGTSAYTPELKETQTSVDCSGLIHLLHRRIGIKVPRNAHDQYQKAEKLKADVHEGDLIFTAKSSSERISHVMLVSGFQQIIEATDASSSVVRELSFKDRFGSISLEGPYHNNQVLYFGAFVNK